MAITYEVCGFEGGDATGYTALAGSSANAGAVRLYGSYGFRAAPSASASFGVQVGKGLTMGGSGEAHAAYAQFFFRWTGAPSANGAMLCGFQDWAWIQCNTDNSALLQVAGFGSTAVTIPSYSDTTNWYRVQIRQFTHNNAGAFGTTHKLYWVVIDHWTAGVRDFYNYASMTGANIGFTGSVTPFTCGSVAGVGSPQTWQVDYDDALYVAATGLTDMNAFSKWSYTILNDPNQNVFVGDAVIPAVIDAQGSSDDFTPSGAYTDINEIPKGAGSIVSAAGSGATTYDNAPLPNYVASVEAYTFRANAKTVPTQSNFLITHEGDISVPMTGASDQANQISPFATIVPASPIAKATFDAYASQFGVRNGGGTSVITISNLFTEVLFIRQNVYDGDVDFDFTPGFDAGGGKMKDGDVSFPLPSNLRFRAAATGRDLPDAVVSEDSSWHLQRLDIKPKKQEHD